ncbi:MAG TPA: MFS transporter [Steroidobacteraceae bacterium]|nr:MFS transporter [Steroidobacteraceae bacterium]
MTQSLQINRLVDEQRIGWFNLGLLVWSFLAMLADGYDILALSFAQPEMQTLWHVPNKDFGWASSAALVGILFGAPVLGNLGDRLGRKGAIITGSVIYGLSSLSIVWAHDIGQVMMLRFVAGIGLGGIMPNTIALNAELAPERWRATLITLMFVGITLGGSVPGLIAYALVPHYGWRVLFLIGGIVPLAVAACLARFLPESIKFLALKDARHRELVATVRRMRPDVRIADDAQLALAADLGAGAAANARLATGQLFSAGLAWITPLLWVCFATALMANYFLNSFLPLIFRDTGLPAGKAALAATLYHVGGTVGGLVMSVLLDRFGFVVIALLFAVAAPAIAGLGLAPTSFGALAPLATLAGLAVLGAQFGNNAAAGLLYPTEVRSKGVGWALGIGRFGAILGPSIGGVLLDMHLPLSQLFLAAAAPMLVGAVAALALVRLCYVRLGGLRLGDVPVARQPKLAQGASASVP